MTLLWAMLATGGVAWWRRSHLLHEWPYPLLNLFAFVFMFVMAIRMYKERQSRQSNHQYCLEETTMGHTPVTQPQAEPTKE
jgi:hypothetical protein